MTHSILVIEDDEVIGSLLEFMLTRSGYAVRIVSDGLEASHLIRTSSYTPDVVLLDMMLPHRDGQQLLGEIRSSSAWRNVPVLMLTAKAQDTAIAQALSAGATDYILKPFTPDDVLARIRQAIGGKAT
jgi:two-component system response regulator MtrA